MRQSKLTKDKPSATVTYPESVQGPVTVTVTPSGGDSSEPYKKKITFGKSGGGQDGSGQGQKPKPQGDIQAKVTQDKTNPRKVTVEVTQGPGDKSSSGGQQSSGGGRDGGGSSSGGSSSGGQHQSGGHEQTGASSDQQ